jgi:hypothetical protein
MNFVNLAQNKSGKLVFKTTGDVSGMSVRSDNQNWTIYLEAKNAKQYSSKWLPKFKSFSNLEYSIFILLSHHSFSQLENQSERKGKIIYLVLNGISKEDFSLDIEYASESNSIVTLEELKKRLNFKSKTSNNSLDTPAQVLAESITGIGTQFVGNILILEQGIVLRKMGHKKGGVQIKIPSTIKELIDIAKNKLRNQTIIKIYDREEIEKTDISFIKEGNIYYGATEKD